LKASERQVRGHDLGSEVDPRFGRTSKFLLVDTDTMSFEVIENTQGLHLPQGAGIQAAQTIIRHNPDAVLTGNCGPKAFKVLQAADVKVVTGVKGKIVDAIQAYLEGRHQPAQAPNVEGHWV
jgi:predicted Fe-Mo cluster-binding NifX family protein